MARTRTRKATANVEIKIRMKEPLRANVERAAKRKGISMNAELVERVEQGERNELRMSDLEETLGGGEASGLLMVIGRAMQTAARTASVLSGAEPGTDHWLSDPVAYDQAVKAATAILEAMRPPGEVRPLPSLGISNNIDLDDVRKRAGELVANGLLISLAGVEVSGQLSEFAKSVAPRLPATNLSSMRAKLRGKGE